MEPGRRESPSGGGLTSDVLVFGATSMVGSHFVKTTSLAVAAAGRADPSGAGLPVERFDRIDLLDPLRVHDYVRATNEPVVVNFAARTDVDGVEKERVFASSPALSPAWVVNAEVPGALSRAMRARDRYLIQISTDFVFDGRSGPYDEQSGRSPLSPDLSWYGWTKGEGERQLGDGTSRVAVVRISYPYRAAFPFKLDFARRMVRMQKAGQLPPLYSDQQITPTWVPDVTRVLGRLISEPRSGVFHVASPGMTTPLEFGTELLSLVEGKVPQLARGLLGSAERPPGRAPRPLRGGLTTSRLAELGVSPTDWRKGIRELAVAEGWTN